MTRARQPIAAIDPVCLECGRLAAHRWGTDVWPDRRHLQDVPVFACECGAWAFCHRGSDIPKGFPALGPHHHQVGIAERAIESLIAAKIRQDGGGKEARRLDCATWLAGQLGIAVESCHPAHMSKADVRRTIDLCEPLAARIQARETKASRERREAAWAATPADEEGV